MYQPLGGNERFVKAAEEFDAKHGGDPVFIGEAKLGGYYLYRTGGTRPYDELCLAPGQEPPADEKKRKLLILKYYEVRAKEAEKRFRVLQRNLALQAHDAQMFAGRGGPLPPNDADEVRLLALQADAHVKSEDFRRIRDEMPEVDYQTSEDRDQGVDAIRMRALAMAGRIDAIKL